MLHPFDPIQGLQRMRVAAPAFGIPVRCTDCRHAFSAHDPLRQLRTLDGQLALCSECTWHLEHPDERGR